VRKYVESLSTDVMRTFCDVVETSSFTRAAEMNGISQSAVSQQVAALERDLGTRLLIRGGTGAEATDVGKAFYRGAKDILARLDRMVEEVAGIVKSACPLLRVGTIYSVGFYLLDAYVRKFIKAHPEVKLEVRYTKWDEIISAVLGGEMDLGIVAFPEKQRSLEIIPFADEELMVVCAPGHRLADRASVDPSDLRGERFVAFEANVPTRRFIDRMLRAGRVSVDVCMEFDNNDTLKRAVEVGAGLSIVPKGIGQREESLGQLCFIPFRQPSKWIRKICIIRRRGREHSKAEMLFLRTLRSPI